MGLSEKSGSPFYVEKRMGKADSGAKTPMPDAYKKAKSVLQSLKKLFSNQKLSRHRKEDLKTTIEVLGELRKSMAKSDVEKRRQSEEYISVMSSR